MIKKIGKNIRAFRLEKGTTQEVLAEKIGVHPTYIGKIELGISSPSLTVLYNISQALEIRLSLLTDVD